MDATEPVVVSSVEKGIATITINRPAALNALDARVLDSIGRTVSQVDARALIITGAGEKAFVAGADIAAMVEMDAEEAEAFSRRGQEAFQALADFPGPTVAAINGFALGGGLELALACDILVAADTARLGLPESTLGVVPGFGGTQRLPRRVGSGAAKRLMFTGEMVDAGEALRLGLVDMVSEPDSLLANVHRMLEKALRNGPLAVQEIKRLVDEGMEMGLDDALSLEAAAFGGVFGSADKTEGMTAFLEKRKPVFRGA